jgi:hypothetical protein
MLLQKISNTQINTGSFDEEKSFSIDPIFVLFKHISGL